MISYYATHDGELRHAAGLSEGPVLRVDMLAPDAQELARMYGQLGLALPTRDDQEEIEQYSRLYLGRDVPVMTALLPARSETGETIVGPVSFVLMADRLVTLRHHAPHPFTTYPDKAGRTAYGCDSAEAVLVGQIEEIIDRLADIIEQNAIVKMFPVVAVAFLSHTLVASIYGMNFQVMPELSRHHGYPFALAVMVLSAAVPLWFFRKRGWLWTRESGR